MYMNLEWRDKKYMKRVAKFEKVSWPQFQKDYVDTFGKNVETDMSNVKDIYDNIQLPTRATVGSAGYDFRSPIDFTLNPDETIKIPTGIRVKIDDGWVLEIYPRSSLGFKYKMRTSNIIPIIDSDYCFSNNEGHIFLKISNEGERILCVNAGDKIVQGIFVPYGITIDDSVMSVRNGGIGSTGN